MKCWSGKMLEEQLVKGESSPARAFGPLAWSSFTIMSLCHFTEYNLKNWPSEGTDTPAHRGGTQYHSVSCTDEVPVCWSVAIICGVAKWGNGVKASCCYCENHSALYELVFIYHFNTLLVFIYYIYITLLDLFIFYFFFCYSPENEQSRNWLVLRNKLGT